MACTDDPFGIDGSTGVQSLVACEDGQVLHVCEDLWAENQYVERDAVQRQLSEGVHENAR